MYNANLPKKTVKLVFAHHSCGSNWLADDNGKLGIALAKNNYYVSDTNYGWGPEKIGDQTDIGHWWSWFRGEKSKVYMDALYTENEKHGDDDYCRLSEIPPGENEVILFKSCYPNSNLKGSPSDPIPPISENPLRGLPSRSEHHTVSNAMGIYIDLLEYFKTRQDKLFITVTAPPVMNIQWSENTRLFNNWLVYEWLKDYPYKNVAVYDLYNVLTSNGGSPQINDLGLESGNHHYFKDGTIRHIIGEKCDTNKYPVGEKDNHPDAAGNLKATGEFIDILNIFYNEWLSSKMS